MSLPHVDDDDVLGGCQTQPRNRRRGGTRHHTVDRPAYDFLGRHHAANAIGYKKALLEPLRLKRRCQFANVFADDWKQ